MELELPLGLSNLVPAWLDAKRALKRATAAEKELRTEIIESAFDAPQLKEGTNTVKFQGTVIKAAKPFIYKVDPSFPPEYSHSDCIKVEYKLVKAEYNKLSDEGKAKLQEWLTITPGSVTLTVIQDED